MNPNLMMGKVDIGNQPVTKNELNTFNQSLVKPASTNPVANTTPGTFTGATSNTNFVSTPTVVSNYGMQNKVADITTDYYKYTNKNPTPQQQVEQTGQVNTPSIDFSTLPFTQDANGVKKYFNQETGAYDLFGPSGQTTEYRGFTVPTDTLSDPYSKSTYDNAAQARAQNKQALADQLEAIAKRYEGYRRTQQQLTESGASGVQNALLQSGAGGRGSVAQYAAATADARVKTIMEDGQRAIEQLGLKEQELVSAAHSAYEAEDWKILGEINSQIEKVRREQIEASSVINKKIAEEQIEADALRKQTLIDNSIAEIYSSGVTDTGEIMRKMREAGVLVTSKQVKDTLSNIASGLNTDTNGLDQTTKEFYRLKQVNGLPSYISSLVTEGEQLLAYVRARTGAESKAVQRTTNDGRTVTKTTGDYIPPTDIEIDDPFLQKLADTKGGRFLADTSIQKLDKAATVLSQLGVLQENIAKEDTGPIVGLMREKNPWDTKAQTIKAQLNAIIPNLARGVYGEVGVLTDQDIANYGKTLPNLKSTEEIRNAILYITLDMVTKSMRTTLDTNASAGRDVSGFVDYYRDLEKNKNSILSTIPNAKVPNSIKIKSGSSYSIQPGDELRNIAPKYGTTVEVLMKLNPNLNPNNLKVGENINLPVDSAYGGYTLPGGEEQVDTFQGYTLPN